MKESALSVLRCPDCKSGLAVKAENVTANEIMTGQLTCVGCGAAFPILRGVPRFVNTDSYADAFSFEWNVHRTTQLDSATGKTDSVDRFTTSLGFPLSELNGKLVLDIGCGTGRFAEIALKNGATVVGVDLSLAVDAAYTNIGTHPRMHIVQADVFKLPLARDAFDVIYSLGVLHHTPDCRKAFEQLPPHLKHGGKVIITVYTDRNKYYCMSTNFWRKWTPRLPKRLLYAMCHVAVPLYYLYKIPGVRVAGMGVLPINMDPRAKWRVLDTFDCYSPTYQSYHNFPEVFEWFETAGLRDIRAIEPEVTVVGTRSATVA